MLKHLDESLQRYPYAARALLLLVLFAVFSGTFKNGFVTDDKHQILENPLVTNPHLWPRIFLGPALSPAKVSAQSNFYRPLHFITTWLVYRAAGPNPVAFHLVQLLIYAATIALVHPIGQKLLRNELAAYSGSLLWALHPLHVEAVSWIASLCDAGFGFFYLLAFLLFLRAEDLSDKKLTAQGPAALAFFFALFFKEMALSFPLLVLAYWALNPEKENWSERAAGPHTSRPSSPTWLFEGARSDSSASPHAFGRVRSGPRRRPSGCSVSTPGYFFGRSISAFFEPLSWRQACCRRGPGSRSSRSF